MKTEHQFAEVLKKMMESMPLDEISVTTLSKRCGVSRKTFYYHFRDVYDLLTLVFLDEKITANNVRFGDVYLLGGQSNMELIINMIMNLKKINLIEE